MWLELPLDSVWRVGTLLCVPSGAEDVSQQDGEVLRLCLAGGSFAGSPQGRQRRLVPVYLVALMEMGAVGVPVMQSELLWAQGLSGNSLPGSSRPECPGPGGDRESLAELTSARPPREHFLPCPRQTGKFIRENRG